MYRLGVIGAGNMGMAILNGAISSGAVKAQETAVFDLDAEKKKNCEGKGCAVLEDEREVYKESAVLLFAVKPQNFETLLNKLSGLKPPEGQIIVTIAAGVSTGYIRSFLKQSKKLIRVMPNTPLLIGKGASFLSKSEEVTDAEFEKIRAIFGAMGETAVIPEDKMNEVIPVNGSSPAFVYYFIDAVAKSAEKMGVDYDTALRLAAATFIGSAEMILKSGKTPEELI
ncbi:MAG: pyrroline-5-carboxylate reductase, partial [Bacillota bacterium]|nr:pyrroline-5-carboxylate reductase [Bacillota bacterium]